jgi:hypothetical protein
VRALKSGRHGGLPLQRRRKALKSLKREPMELKEMAKSDKIRVVERGDQKED